MLNRGWTAVVAGALAAALVMIVGAKAADDADEAGVLRAVEPVQQLGASDVAGAGWGDAVWNNDEAIGGEAVFRAVVADCRAVGDVRRVRDRILDAAAGWNTVRSYRRSTRAQEGAVLVGDIDGTSNHAVGVAANLCASGFISAAAVDVDPDAARTQRGRRVHRIDDVPS